MSEKDIPAETIKLSQSGDHEAFETLYHTDCSRVYFLALKITGSKEAAEDIVQETFISVFKEIKSLENPLAYRTWLNRIVINKCKNHLIKNKEQPVSASEETDFEEKADKDEEFLPHVALDRAETREMIMKVIYSLPPEQRMALLLYYYEEFTVLQIAEIMDCPPNTVKSRLYYGRQQIKLAVEGYEKQGVKLYGAVPVPVLTELLRELAENNKLTEKTAERLLKGALKGAGKAANVVAGGHTNLIAKITSLSLKAKLISSAVAVVIVASVVSTAVLTTAAKPVAINTDSGGISRSQGGSSILAENSASDSLFHDTVVNTVGNSTSNIKNDGLATVQGQSTYLHLVNGEYTGSFIVDDGAGKRLFMIYGGLDINVVGDWIYFVLSLQQQDGSEISHMYKMSTGSDGKSFQQLNAEDVSQMSVVGDWIYYTNYSDNGCIYKMHTDGTEETKLNSTPSAYINVVDGWIYYCDTTNGYDNGAEIYKIKTDGTGLTDLKTKGLELLVTDGYVYYKNLNDGVCLYRVKIDGTGNEKVSDSECMCFNVQGDWLYTDGTSAGNRYLYKISISTKQKIQLNSDHTDQICLIGDWIYYINQADDNSTTLYRIHTDGTGRQEIVIE